MLIASCTSLTENCSTNKIKEIILQEKMCLAKDKPRKFCGRIYYYFRMEAGSGKNGGPMWRKLILIVLCAVSILNFPSPTMAEGMGQDMTQVSEPKDQDIVPQVQSWLELVDKGQYEQSWDEAGAYLKLMVKKEKWEQQISTVRKLFGDFVSRSLKAQQYLKTLPGAPDGEYCVLSFDTVFSEKASAVETVTVVKDEFGHWRVVGYFVK